LTLTLPGGGLSVTSIPNPQIMFAGSTPVVFSIVVFRSTIDRLSTATFTYSFSVRPPERVASL
jgi:hypothetical protein